MTTSTEPYVIRPTGLKGFAMKAALKSMKPLAPTLGAMLIVDTAGIHWPDPQGKQEFVLAWDEIAEIVHQRYMGVWGLYVVAKDPKAVMARHPRKDIFMAGPSPFVIPKSYAKPEDVIEHIRRFSDVPIRKK